MTLLLSDTHKSTGAISVRVAFTRLTGSFVWVALYQLCHLFFPNQTRTSWVLQHQAVLLVRARSGIVLSKFWTLLCTLSAITRPSRLLNAGQTGCVGKYQGR